MKAKMQKNIIEYEKSQALNVRNRIEAIDPN